MPPAVSMSPGANGHGLTLQKEPSATNPATCVNAPMTPTIPRAMTALATDRGGCGGAVLVMMKMAAPKCTPRDQPRLQAVVSTRGLVDWMHRPLIKGYIGSMPLADAKGPVSPSVGIASGSTARMRSVDPSIYRLSHVVRAGSTAARWPAPRG